MRRLRPERQWRAAPRPGSPRFAADWRASVAPAAALGFVRRTLSASGVHAICGRLGGNSHAASASARREQGGARRTRRAQDQSRRRDARRQRSIRQLPTATASSGADRGSDQGGARRRRGRTTGQERRVRRRGSAGNHRLDRRAAAAPRRRKPKLPDRCCGTGSCRMCAAAMRWSSAAVAASSIAPGGILPGLGRMQPIKRQDGHWVVVTPGGSLPSTISARPAPFVVRVSGDPEFMRYARRRSGFALCAANARNTVVRRLINRASLCAAGSAPELMRR